MFMDSQSLCADPYVKMGGWAVATERLKLSTGVTNPLTRHPAVTATAAATVQSISGGRAVLGIGRGDSALGLSRPCAGRPRLISTGAVRPANSCSAAVKSPLAPTARGADAPSIDTMSLGGRPTATRLQWLPEGMPKVPLDVAATGPKVIAMSAPLAERLTFSVGAIPERIRLGHRTRSSGARKKQNLTDAGVSYGAQIIVVCHPEIEAVRQIATTMVAPLARFQVIQGDAAGPKSDNDAENFAAIRRGYDMTKHAMCFPRTE